MAYYCTKQQLNQEIAALKATGVISPDLHEILVNLFSGTIKRYNKHTDEDLEQDCWLWFIQNYDKCDPAQDCFSYLTHCVINRWRKKKNDNKRQITLGGLSVDGLPNLTLEDIQYMKILLNNVLFLLLNKKNQPMFH